MRHHYVYVFIEFEQNLFLKHPQSISLTYCISLNVCKRLINVNIRTGWHRNRGINCSLTPTLLLNQELANNSITEKLQNEEFAK